jgi:hypothetical protein|tara:strand:- start:884 stop:1132 length:249 start_codon:yes stop_codon:yes gene_type:complete
MTADIVPSDEMDRRRKEISIWESGYLAFKKGTPRREAPGEPGSIEEHTWINAWDEADDDSRCGMLKSDSEVAEAARSIFKSG